MNKHLQLNTIILSFLFLFTIQSVQAQNYKPVFGDTSSRWDGIFLAYCDFYIPGVIEQTNKSVTIDSVEYKMLLNSVRVDNPSFDTLLVREDTVKGEAFIFDQVDSVEFKFYDMSLFLGDTMVLMGDKSDDTLIVGEVVNIDTIDNRKVITFSREIYSCLSGVNPPIRFIEGIGTSALLADNRILLTCKETDGETVYVNEFGFPCRDESSTDEIDINNTTIQLSPNPTTNQVQINLTDHSSINDIQIFDAAGRLLHTVSNINQANYILSFADFTTAKGVFFLKIALDGRIYSKRIVRH